MGLFFGITVYKGWPRVGAWTGTLKNPTKCLWRWEPDGRSNFCFTPPAHLCAVTYITEISLHVTLSKQSNSKSFNKPTLYIRLLVVLLFTTEETMKAEAEDTENRTALRQN